MVAAAAPSTIDPWIKRRRQVGDCGRLIAPNPVEKLGEKGKKKYSSSPASRVQGKKKTYSAVKTAPFWAFFFLQQLKKRRRFGQNALFHLKEKGSKTRQISKKAFNLRAFYNFVLGLGFLQFSP